MRELPQPPAPPLTPRPLFLFELLLELLLGLLLDLLCALLLELLLELLERLELLLLLALLLAFLLELLLGLETPPTVSLSRCRGPARAGRLQPPARAARNALC